MKPMRQPEAARLPDAPNKLEQRQYTITDTRASMAELLTRVESSDARSLYDLLQKRLHESSDSPKYKIGVNRQKDLEPEQTNEIEFTIG